jgi:glucose/arabinose dehydrogenase
MALMKTLVRLMIAGAFVLSCGAVGYAQMQANPPAAPAAPAAPAMPKAKKAPMSAKSKECSEKATAQGLHGKARKEYREKCKKGEE